MALRSGASQRSIKRAPTTNAGSQVDAQGAILQEPPSCVLSVHASLTSRRTCLKSVVRKWLSTEWAPPRNSAMTSNPYCRLRGRMPTAEHTLGRTREGVCVGVNVNVHELRLGFSNTTRNPEGILSHNNKKMRVWGSCTVFDNGAGGVGAYGTGRWTAVCTRSLGASTDSL